MASLITSYIVVCSILSSSSIMVTVEAWPALGRRQTSWPPAAHQNHAQAGSPSIFRQEIVPAGIRGRWPPVLSHDLGHISPECLSVPTQSTHVIDPGPSDGGKENPVGPLGCAWQPRWPTFLPRQSHRLTSWAQYPEICSKVSLTLSHPVGSRTLGVYH